MSAVDNVDQLIEQYQLALGDFVKGNPEPVKQLFSHREDVSLANPLGPPARGWEQVAQTVERAASNFTDGEMVGFENVLKYVTPDLACVVWLERAKVKLGGMEDFAPSTLRVTMVFRPEERRRHNRPTASRISARGVELLPALLSRTLLPRTRVNRL
jgi:ketosteroid isomerase-like protein